MSDRGAASPLSGWVGVVLGAPSARDLASFYSELLGVPLTDDHPHWCTIRLPGSRANLAFQTEEGYERPVWPSRPGRQQMMAHLDLGVLDLAAAVRRAQDLGATLARHQPEGDVRVLRDPAGHPFCLYLDAGGGEPVRGTQP